MSEPASINPRHAAALEPGAHADAILRLLDRPIVPGELDAGAALAALPAEQGSRRFVRLLLFRVGEETAALPIMALRRATPATRAVPIPRRSGGTLRGVCNIRGELVLCADLHRLLGLPERDRALPGTDASADQRRMIVIGPADNSWAFEVDALIGVESVDPSLFRDAPVTVGHSIGDFTRGVAQIEGRCVTVLDAERVLAGFQAGLA